MEINFEFIRSSFYLFLLALLPLLIILYIIIRIIRNNNEAIRKSIEESHLINTENESIKISKIRELNSKSFFYDIESIKLKRTCSSKTEFDRLDLTDFFITCISEDPNYYNEYINQTNYNRSEYQKYLTIFNEIIESENDEISEQYEEHPYMKKYEELLFEKHRLTPLTQAAAVITKNYTSPQGRKDYFDQIIAEEDKIIECIDEAYKRIYDAEIYESTRNRERELMTPSLRYSIMKRDNFRCVLCGATSEDGAKLHVDHIIPVSKGGKTEISNLRTLCSTCNLGKSAKYDPYGPN